MAAWKLVSNDAKRTVAPPNAKHSTLLQGCFLCFCFWFHSRFDNNAESIPRVFPQNGGLLSVLSIPAIHAIISRCFLGLWEVCTFAVEKRRYIMKLVVEFLMSICHGVVVFVSCIGKLPRKLWRFNKKHHCISYDNNSIDSLYDWDDDDDF